MENLLILYIMPRQRANAPDDPATATDRPSPAASSALCAIQDAIRCAHMQPRIADFQEIGQMLLQPGVAPPK